MKKLKTEELKKFRDRLELPIPDRKLDDAPYYHPGPDSPEVQYLLERRRALGGCVPQARRARQAAAARPPAKVFAEFVGRHRREPGGVDHDGVRQAAAEPDARPSWGKRVVPIIPDEARTFGMEVLFREIGIYAAVRPEVRAGRLQAGALLHREEGRPAARGGHHRGRLDGVVHRRGTSYATHGEPMIPFYIFYSMFGFQRTGDLIWAFGDARGRGFLLGATAGRTTLNGEGLQHEDGHSHVLASTVPNVRRLRPGVRLRGRGDRRATAAAACTWRARTSSTTSRSTTRTTRCRRCPSGVEDGILRGLYLLPRRRAAGEAPRAALRQRRDPARRRCARRRSWPRSSSVAADVWSVTSYQQLRNEALAVRALEPAPPGRAAARALRDAGARGVAGAGRRRRRDYMKSVPDMIARWIPRPFTLARHRRLRPQRHARGAAPPLRDRRRAHRRRHALGAGPAGPHLAGRGGKGDRGVRARSRGPGSAERVAGVRAPGWMGSRALMLCGALLLTSATEAASAPVDSVAATPRPTRPSTAPT